MAKSYYAILGVPSNAGQEEIKSAYRQLAKKYHPDHAEGDAKKFRDIQEAYSALADHDSKGRPEKPPSGERVRVRPRPSPRTHAYTSGPEPLIPGRDPVHRPGMRSQRPFTSGRSAMDSDEDLLDWIFRRFF